jgi:hypothetical protein
MKMNATQMPQTTHRPDRRAPKRFGLEANESVTACNALKLPEAVARKRLKNKET